ncbi:MAG: GFA family protein, partial [Pseudomonadota bacterium]
GESATMDGNASCGCGAVNLEVRGQPLFRCLCHCTICQRFNAAPFGDVTVFTADDVDVAANAPIDFERLRPPPNVQRGKCRECARPAVEQAVIPFLPDLTIVPTSNLRPADRPDPAMHIFYRHRVADVDDTLPRYDGYLSSQLAFARMLIGALRRR